MKKQLDWPLIGALIVWVIIVAAIATLFTACGPDECRRCGGHWETYNCRDTSYFAPIPDGNGGMTVMFVPDTTCDHSCVGTRPYRAVRGINSHGATTTRWTCAPEGK